jgi:hypothetical protein
MGTGVRECGCRGQAYAAARAGDQRALSIQSQRWRSRQVEGLLIGIQALVAAGLFAPISRL